MRTFDEAPTLMLESGVVDLIHRLGTQMRAVDLGVAGGWLLFIDMILSALLFMFWEKAGQIALFSSKR